MQKLKIDGIPALLWGSEADKIYIHVHGKMSDKESAEAFAKIAVKKGYQVLSFDLPEHGERTGETNYACDIWNGPADLKKVLAFAKENWKDINLCACSLGAYFSLHAYKNEHFGKCLFMSPIVEMEHLVKKMMLWFGVTEERLEREKIIDNPIDPLSWDYYQYVKAHPIEEWSSPTSILYGSEDNLQDLSEIEKFAEKFHCKLTISQGSEHAFMEEKDSIVIDSWLGEEIV